MPAVAAAGRHPRGAAASIRRGSGIRDASTSTLQKYESRTPSSLARDLPLVVIMRNDATHPAGDEPELLAPLEPQPELKTAAEIAFARAGIRRLAGPALDNARTILSAEKPTSNAPV